MTTQDNGANDSVDHSSKNPVDSQKSDVVPLASHRQLLDEKKKVQAELNDRNAKLAEYEAAAKASEEAKLAADRKWEELAKLKDDEVKKKDLEIRKRDEILHAKQRERDEEIKRTKVMEELGTKFKKPQYEKFLNIDEVPDDAEERRQWIAKFKADNGDLLVVSNVTPPPGTAPQSGSVAPRKELPKTSAEWATYLREYNKPFAEKIQGSSFNDLFKKKE
jgi:hypothetical protein